MKLLTFVLKTCASIFLFLIIIGIGNLSANEFQLTEITFKGWMDTDFKSNDKPGNKPYIDAHHLYLITEARLQKGFRAFIELEIEHSPNTGSDKGTVKLERLYSQIDIDTRFNVRIGKFNTPFGSWTPTHWAILVETVEKPIHENNKYVPPKSVGVEFLGRLFVGDNDIEWNAFFSNGTEFEATNKPADRTFGGGADARLNFLEGNAHLGGSFYNQHNPSKENRSENNFVGYGGFDAGQFSFSSEYISQSRGEGDQGTVYEDVKTFYVNGKYYFKPEYALGMRYDSGDDDKSGAGDKHQISTFYFNWMPIPSVLGKAEYNAHSFDAPTKDDFNSWSLYFGLLF